MDDVERSGTAVVKTEQVMAAPRVLTDSGKRAKRTREPRQKCSMINSFYILIASAVLFFSPLNIAQDAFRC